MNPLIGKVELPFREIDVNTRGTVTGWGKTHSGELPDRLVKLDVEIISDEDCLSDYAVPRTDREDFFCAHKSNNEGYGVCQGDSGSGLILHHRVVVGVVSHSSLCGKFPDVSITCILP